MMKKIHNNSLTTTISELELFTLPPTQIAAERNFKIQYRPLAALTNQPVKFQIKTPLDHYIFFHETYFYLKVRLSLQKKDADDQAAIAQPDWNQLIPSNYLLHSMIKSCEISMNHEQLFKAPKLYAYKSYLEALLGYSDNSKKCILSGSLWESDEASRSKYFHPAGRSGSTGKVVELMGRLHLDLTHQSKALIGGSDVNVEIEFNKPEFFLKTDSSKYNVSLELVEAFLEVTGVKVYPEIVEAHAKAIKVAPAKYPITYGDVQTFQISAGIKSHLEDHVVVGQLLRRMF